MQLSRNIFSFKSLACSLSVGLSRFFTPHYVICEKCHLKISKNTFLHSGQASFKEVMDVHWWDFSYQAVEE